MGRRRRLHDQGPRPQTNGAFGFIEATVPAVGGPPPHTHPDEEETFYLL